MQGKPNYKTVGAGWLNEKNGKEYISVRANGERNEVKLLVQLEDGTTKPLDKFFVSFNADKKQETSPDVSVWFVEE